MSGGYQTWIVVLSIVVAIATSHAALRLFFRMRRLEAAARRHAAELSQANQRLQHTATHDALTGLQNRNSDDAPRSSYDRQMDIARGLAVDARG